MNCKFHPTAEAVTTCATCGAGMCSSCENGAFFHTEDDKPLCLECSLKEAEDELTTREIVQKDFLRDGIIASVIWILGIALGGKVYVGFYLLMLVAAIFLYKSSLFTSEERDFFEKIRAIFWQIVLCTLLFPLAFIYLLICGKWDKIKAKKKVNKIKAALGNVN